MTCEDAPCCGCCGYEPWAIEGQDEDYYESGIPDMREYEDEYDLEEETCG